MARPAGGGLLGLVVVDFRSLFDPFIRLMRLSPRFIVRFDDVTSGMAWSRFLPIKKRLEHMNVKAVLGVVPDCQDATLTVEAQRPDFFDVIRQYKAYGDAIAQHGTFHLYDSDHAGLLNVAARSEFAGHPYQLQLARLRQGQEILTNQRVWDPYFMAPSHSLDRNTIRALKDLGFSAVTDGYGFRPYQVDGILFVPQLTELPVHVPFGYQTLCLHVNTMAQAKLDKIMQFIELHRDQFCDFREVATLSSTSSALDAVLRWATEKGLGVVRTWKGSR